MSARGVLASTLLAMLAVTGATFPASAQGWSADVSAGRIAYDPITIGEATSNVVGTLQYETRSEKWIYGSAAAPLRDPDPLWSAAGGGGRFLLPRSVGARVTVGADVAGEAFLFRDQVARQSGTGASLDALPFVRWAHGRASVEAHGGWRGQALSMGGLVERRAVLETGGRATFDTPSVRADAGVRLVGADGSTYPFVGGSIVYGGNRGYLSARLGRWLGGALDDIGWGAGGGIALGARSTVWVSLRQEPSDPLYWNAPRRTWSIGMTQRLGRVPLPLQPAARVAGGVVIRLRSADASGDELWIAGDFNNWTPVRMQRDGGEWVVRLTLAPGVYKYSFRRGDAEWFVPASEPSRRDDGMGGHVAVLLVM